MSKCRYDLSENCHNKDCLTCVLDKIRAEITNDIHKCNNTDMAFGMQHTLDIIDKYKAERG